MWKNLKSNAFPSIQLKLFPSDKSKVDCSGCLQILMQEQERSSEKKYSFFLYLFFQVFEHVF